MLFCWFKYAPVCDAEGGFFEIQCEQSDLDNQFLPRCSCVDPQSGVPHGPVFLDGEVENCEEAKTAEPHCFTKCMQDQLLLAIFCDILFTSVGCLHSLSILSNTLVFCGGSEGPSCPPTLFCPIFSVLPPTDPLDPLDHLKTSMIAVWRSFMSEF